MANALFEIRLRVSRGEGCDMPAGMAGAYVACYAAASDYQAALKSAVHAVGAMRLRFEDVVGEVRELSCDRWSEYVSQAWPEFAARLPTQAELPELVKSGAVFFGPFAGFE